MEGINNMMGGLGNLSGGLGSGLGGMFGQQPVAPANRGTG
jgi:hypothetical protein